MSPLPTLDGLPPEVLERIGFFAGGPDAAGPPAGLAALACTARLLHVALAPAHNPALYARLFGAKFDGDAPLRRLAPYVPPATALRDEFVRRCVALGRMRRQVATWAAAPDPYDYMDGAVGPWSASPDPVTEGDLWTLYVLLLEDGGRNAYQAREWGQAHAWLSAYWRRALRVNSDVEEDSPNRKRTSRGWAPDTARNALAMWCLWFLLEPDEHDLDDGDMMTVLKVLSHGGHRYQLVSPYWANFEPPTPALDRTAFPDANVAFFYGYLEHPTLVLSPPPLGAAAALAFMALRNHPRARTPRNRGAGAGFQLPLLAPADPIPPSLPCAAPRAARDTHEWDGEWARVASLGAGRMGRALPPPAERAVRPGSLSGVWEGMFMYTEFHVYGALLVGAPPVFVERAGLAQHRQTWRLREHHLLSGVPLRAGGALEAHMPASGIFAETSDVLRVTDPRTGAEHVYYTWDADAQGHPGAPPELAGAEVLDTLLTGEGHSAWGGFALRGRVRTLDGLLTVQKRYAGAGGAERGEWLYRGLLVGAGPRANIGGRWRECMTPAQDAGYEGCFALSRRG